MCSFNYHMSRWHNGCKEGSKKCMVCHNTSNKPPHHSTNCPILNRIGLKLVKRTPADGNAASQVGKVVPPTSTHAAPLVPTTPTEAGRGGSASTPGAFTAATELDTYNSGNEFNYEGKYKGKVYQANSAKSKSNVSIYPRASHTTTEDPVSHSTSTTDPGISILSPSTSCRHSTSIDPKGVKTIQLPKLVLALLNNPPAHLTAFALLKSWPATSLLIADTGATDHMIPHKSAFISYKPATGRRVRMGNNSFAPILGTSLAIISINGKRILIRDCLHVPTLRNPLYSLRAHQRQHGYGHIGMHQLGMYVFFPSFIVEVNTNTDCHLSYEPIGHLTSIDKLDYVQPVQAPSPSASTTATTTPSAPTAIKDEDNHNDVMPTYAAHWPKMPLAPSTPPYNMSLIPPLTFSTRLHYLDCDKLIRRIYLLEHAAALMLNFHANTSPTPADSTKVQSAPKALDCMSVVEIRTNLHHPHSCFPPIQPCNTPNTSNSKRAFTPEELHCLTGCHHFRNYQHIISTSNGGILTNTGKFPLSLGTYTTIPKAPCGKPINRILSKYLDIVYVNIAFGNCISIGGYKFALVFVDRATCYNWTFGLKSLQHGDIQSAFLAFCAEAGSLAHQF